MSKLVSNEIYDVVEKLHKAGFSDAVAIEIIRHSRDDDLSKLATAEQVNNLEGKFNILQEDVNDLKSKVDRLEGKFNNLEGDVKLLKEDINGLKGDVKLLKQEVVQIKENMVTKLEFAEFKAEVDVKLSCLRTDIATSGSSLMKWFIVLFATQVISIVGAVLSLFLK